MGDTLVCTVLLVFDVSSSRFLYTLALALSHHAARHVHWRDDMVLDDSCEAVAADLHMRQLEVEVVHNLLDLRKRASGLIAPVHGADADFFARGVFKQRLPANAFAPVLPMSQVTSLFVQQRHPWLKCSVLLDQLTTKNVLQCVACSTVFEHDRIAVLHAPIMAHLLTLHMPVLSPSQAATATALAVQARNPACNILPNLTKSFMALNISSEAVAADLHMSQLESEVVRKHLPVTATVPVLPMSQVMICIECNADRVLLDS